MLWPGNDNIDLGVIACTCPSYVLRQTNKKNVCYYKTQVTHTTISDSYTNVFGVQGIIACTSDWWLCFVRVAT